MKEAMPVLTAGAGKDGSSGLGPRCAPSVPVNKHHPPLLPPAGLHETLALLTSQLRPDANHKEDMVFLKDVFSERSLAYLMKVTSLFLFLIQTKHCLFVLTNTFIFVADPREAAAV